MSQAVQSFKDIETAIHNTGLDYYRLSSKAREELSPCFDLLFAFWRISNQFTNDQDLERYSLEIGGVIFRRIVSSMILLESGLLIESTIIIRNAIEYLAILTDISFNENSLREWEKTSNKTIEEMSQESWYFKFSSIIKRITNNEDACYPQYEMELAKKLDEQWQEISNQSVHAYSHNQIRPIVTGPGEIQLFGVLKEDEYQVFFKRYQATLFMLITGLRRHPAMNKKMKQLEEKQEIQNFLISYNKVLESLKTVVSNSN